MKTLLARLSAKAEQVRRVYLQLFGIPDYERYLEHMETHHPEQAPKSRRAHAAEAIERKYSRAGSRCC